ncbi:Isoamylase precursor [Actinomyces bovis]|uniref:Isoamylase n=1 Tax=Actinomyces bovis TaxID=1658 RepID=A0ABY1VN50_9ACTO|nr:alpha-amylase family glycosyl hydrolase [Actinomyces bovis]SPT53538.1 Isoamylase precursor [Actinomyces bovis]VEG55497.1 Isoamylase precursor [Actinomyces israelii]
MATPSAIAESTWATATWPLGAHPDTDGATTFAVYAPAATRLQLEIYPQALGATASATFLPAKGSDGVWRARLSDAPAGTLFGYRAWGPNWSYEESWTPGSTTGFNADLDEQGNRFNPNKVLFDPYAREVTHNVYTDALAELGVNDGVLGTGGELVDGVPRRQIDTAPYAPKGVVVADATPMAPKPELPQERAIIYEASIRQLTGHPSAAHLADLLHGQAGFAGLANIPAEYLGTYKGAGMLAPYLKSIGVTTIELLPVHETNNSESCRPGKTNAWGYMTLSFFAPNRQYSSDKSWGGPTREFKQMISAFHTAGLEVYLDVVYNHTAEGGNWGGDVNTTGFTSLGGFATAEYYQMTDSKMLVDGATGTSNQLNYSSPVARQLVLDSLGYWCRDMGVDGFRFDLATVLGRKPGAAAAEDWGAQKRFFTDHPLLTAIADLAEQENIEVIAEAWDLWGYEVGNFPRGWGEWNGRYRDAVRRFTKGDGNTIDFLDMVNGDYHHFADNGGPQKSVNFIVAHDGFNLADLVSYQNKSNDQPDPFGPSDGGNDNNLSWDSGGDQSLRRVRLRNLWTILMLSRGVPMIVAGDELGRTQNGNNNPWALDTVAMRNNYAMAATNAPQRVPVAEGLDAAYHDNLGEFPSADPKVNPLLRFASFLMHLRREHAALHQAAWGDMIAANEDVSYLFHTPTTEGYPQEGDRALAVNIDAPSESFWLMLNMTGEQIGFRVPEARSGRQWRRLVDTSIPAEAEGNFWPVGEGAVVTAGTPVEPWSIVVWHEEPVAG